MSDGKRDASIVAAEETTHVGEKHVDADELRLAQMGIYFAGTTNRGEFETNTRL
jgi:hypothetical protein